MTLLLFPDHSLYINIITHHRLQIVRKQCIIDFFYISSIWDLELVVALILDVIHMASDSGADSGGDFGRRDTYKVVTYPRALSRWHCDTCKWHE